ncbi:hypothetical protein [Floridanema evergladense]|uniref:Uncharacterized protein n=1 Tax=Floridaenema evergladense BLCC-F167 TaxID=3153639 RepID=A0ABV4WXJ4_9CYAN
MNDLHIELIHQLFGEADKINMPLWLQGGWASDASIGDKLLRCISWEAILWDYFYYIEEVPQSQWRSKDFFSFALAKESFGEAATQHLHEQFKRQHAS